jgi:hypothetical protein
MGTVKDQMVLGVACFCKKGDLLSQWRGYGSGGYSIGFDAAELKARVADKIVPLVPVAYGFRQSRAVIRKKLRDAALAVPGSPLADYMSTAMAHARAEIDANKDTQALIKLVTAALTQVAIPVLAMSAQLKDASFEEEREWRIADLQDSTSNNVKFRSGPLGVTPYIDLDLTEGETRPPIRRIIVGPGENFAARRTAINMCLRKNGYDWKNIEVVPSKIPFRNG